MVREYVPDAILEQLVGGGSEIHRQEYFRRMREAIGSEKRANEEEVNTVNTYMLFDMYWNADNEVVLGDEDEIDMSLLN